MDLDIRTSKYVQLLLKIEKKPSSHVIHVREVEEFIDAHFSHIDTISSELLQVDQKSTPRQRMHLDELLDRADRIKTSLLSVKYEFQRALLTSVPPADGVRNLRRHLELCLLWEAEAGQLAGVLWEHRKILAFQTDSLHIEGLAKKGWERISAVRGDHVHCLRLLLWKESVNTKHMVHVLREVACGIEEMLAHWQEAKMNAEDHGVALEVFGWDAPAIELLGSAKVIAARAVDAARTRKWDAALVLELGVTAKELVAIVNIAPDEVLRCSVVLKHREVLHKALADYGSLHQTRSLHGFLTWFHKERTSEWVERNHERLSLAFKPLYERYFLEHGVVTNPAQMSLRVDIPLADEVNKTPLCTAAQVKHPTPEYDRHILLDTTGRSCEQSIPPHSDEMPTSSLALFPTGPRAVSDATSSSSQEPLAEPKGVSSSCPVSLPDPRAVVHSCPAPPAALDAVSSLSRMPSPVKPDAVSSSSTFTPSVNPDAPLSSVCLTQSLAESTVISSSSHATLSTPAPADRPQAGSSGDAAASLLVIERNAVPSGPLDALIPQDATAALANTSVPWCMEPISPHGAELRDSFIRRLSRTSEDLTRVTNQSSVKASVTVQGDEKVADTGLSAAGGQTERTNEEADSTVPLGKTAPDDLSVCVAASPRLGHLPAFSAPDTLNSTCPLPKKVGDNVEVPVDHDVSGCDARQGATAVIQAVPSSSSTDLGASTPSIPFGVHNFKQCASESPSLIPEQQRLFEDWCVVFLITRNKNNNVVVYRAPESKNPPLETFWWDLATEPRPANLRSTLNWVEKKFAYGITCKSQPPHHQVRIVALPDRPTILTWDLARHGRPVCIIRVLDRLCILYRVHVHASETAYWPKIKWINIHGIEVSTGVELVETVEP